MLPRGPVGPMSERVFRSPDYLLELSFMVFERRGSLGSSGCYMGGSFVIDGFGLV